MKKKEESMCMSPLLSQREGQRVNEEDEIKIVYEYICVVERQLKTKYITLLMCVCDMWKRLNGKSGWLPPTDGNRTGKDNNSNIKKKIKSQTQTFLLFSQLRFLDWHLPAFLSFPPFSRTISLTSYIVYPNFILPFLSYYTQAEGVNN